MTAYWPVSFKGLRAFCTTYTIDETGTVMLSLVGAVTVLNGLWAAFLSHETLVLNEQIEVRRMQRDERALLKTLAHKAASEYRTLSARLRETGKRHLVIVHQQATQDCEMDRAFFVVQAAEGLPPLARFYAQFTRAVAVCARTDWSEYLWQRGLAAQLIAPCEAAGIQAWRVTADAEAWAPVVREGITSRVIR